MKCETCQHWAAWGDKSHDWDLPNLGSCRKMVRYWTAVFEHDDIESADSPKAIDRYDDDHNEELNRERRRDSKFFVQDGEDCSATCLVTRNDFGCVEHQEKTHEQ